MYNLAWAVILLPLGGFIFAFLPESPRRAAQVCVAFTGFALVVSLVLLGYRLAHVHDNPYQSTITFWTFDPGQKIQGGFISDFHLQIGVLVDGLSTVVLAVVSFVSFTVQLYATSSLRREDGYTRHFTTIALATFAMLALVASPNLFGFWVFWEVLGGCFYVVVGHWWHRPEAAAAARRMFLVTRIGDLALLLGIVFIFAKLASNVAALPPTPGQPANDPFNYFVLQREWAAVMGGHVSGSGPRTVILLSLLILLAAAAKSALFPLHTWLRGVFEEAPAPVTALIAGVTMVAAGVYLVARMYPAFLAAPHLLTVVALLGALAALVGALVACAQSDIRRILAYATVSHVGLMFLALGVGAYSAAIFQLATQAWTMALLVLCAAALVGAYRTSDVDEMGGAWQRLRTTTRALLVGSLSLAGVVGLSGFWSLSAITGGALRNTFPNHGHIGAVAKALVIAALLATIFLGAVYPLRMFFRVALRDLPRRRGFQPQRVREPVRRMRTAMVMLAVVTALGGFVGIPQVRVTFAHYVFAGTVPQGEDWSLLGLAITAVLALLGAGTAWLLHTRPLARLQFGGVGRAFAAGLHVDAAYDWVAERALVRPSPLLGRFDREVERRLFDEAGAAVLSAAEAGRRWQVGRIDVVAVSAVAGVALVAGAVVLGATGHLPWLGATR
jgi:NADH-quinone oxidoreductase subunit L